MDNAHYKYKGKSWRSCPTQSGSNSFFHSAFGTRSCEGEEYLDKDALLRRMRWGTFLSNCASKSMPPRLADVLRKCFSADHTHKYTSPGNMENFVKYISGILACERNVTIEEIPILATLENIQIVVFSNTGPDPVVIVTPNPDLLGNYANPEKAKEEVVLGHEGDIFSKLELVEEVCSPKPNKNVVRNKIANENLIRAKNNSDKYRKGGSAGSKGVRYQVNLLVMVLLNAIRNLRGWKLSTEHEEAGKFDDIVLEHTEGTTFIQSKHKENGKKRITLNELTSTNSKNDDFSLPKYFLSYLQIKRRFKIKNVILCTNANVHEKVLKLLDQHEACSESLLHYDEGDYSFYKLEDEMLPSLKESIKSYYEQNFKKKGVEESEISDENLKDFQQHLQLYFNYPSLDCMEKIIDKSLSLMRCCKSSRGKMCSSEMYLKMKEWYQQEEGTYLTQTHAKAIFSEIWREKYCQELEEYEVSFHRDDLNFQSPIQIFHVVTNSGYLLQIMKIYHAIRSDKKKILFLNIRDDIDIQKQAAEAFGLPKYTFLIIIWSQTTKESVAIEAFGKLKGILEKHKHKKIIVVAEDDDRFVQRTGWDKDFVRVSRPVTFEDLHSRSQEILLKRKNIVFQGEKVSLEEILEIQEIKSYGKALNTEILEMLVKGEEIKVGARLSELDEYIGKYYINRAFKRTLDKTLDEKFKNAKKKGNFLDGPHSSDRGPTLSYKSSTLNEELYGELGQIDSEEEILSEATIYDVKEKIIIISDSAGTGKSTVLAKLALIIKENNPYLWVIWLELNDFTKKLRDSLRNGKKSVSIMELLNSENVTKLTNHLEEFLFSASKKVVLLLDGVDEISPDYTGLVQGLLRQCQEESNFVKIFITTRPHMMKELEQVSKVKPFLLQPFTEKDQIVFLVNYWENGLQLKDDISNEKYRRYAEALLKKWMYLDNNEGNRFSTVPLQLRMMAEIFQENAKSSESAGWEGCKEYVMGSEVQPNISERMDITDLYRIFVEKKQHIFAEKGNPTGNTIASDLIAKIFDDCLVYHKSLALEVILGKDKLQLFSCYQPVDKNIETQMLKIGIVQKIKEEIYFIHRTFADYFVAECLFSEILQNRTLEFQIFLIDTIFIDPQFNVTRTFLDSLLRKTEKYLSPDIFKEYQSLKQETSKEIYKLQSSLLHLLAEEDCMVIFAIILKCMDFKAVRGKEINILNFYTTHFDQDAHKNIFGNTLNLLQFLTKEAGVNIKDERDETPLHHAAQMGNLKMVKILIEEGADINSKNIYGDNPLHLASANGHLKTIRYLFELGMDPHIKNNDGFTALHLATYFGQLETVKLLTMYGYNINTVSNKGHTVLHLASEKGYLDIIRYLFELGIDPHIRNSGGFTALHTATYFGQLEIVKLLTERGSYINVVSHNGSTLLHLASENGHLRTIKYLFELGMDPHSRDNNDFTALQTAAYFGQLETVKFLTDHGSDLNVVSNNGHTLLHLASEKGHLNTIKHLFKLGINPHIKDNDGFTAMHLATYGGQLETVKFLIELGSDINVVSNDKSTLLHLASEKGHLDIIKYLFELGMDPHIRDNGGFAALQTAVYFGQLETVKFLTDHGSDINVISNDGHTLLHLASEKGHLDTIKCLFDVGINPHTKDNDGCTALQVAACSGQLETVKFLTERGSCINVVSNNGSTLLHSASKNGHLDIIKYLFEFGIDPHIRDNDGFTTLQVAVCSGQLEAVKFLTDHDCHINVLSNNGITLLHLASANGHLDTIKYLFELGIDPHIRDIDGFTALQVAASSGQLEAVKFLTDRGSDINVVNNNGRTLLHLASRNGHLETIKYLFEHGINLHVRDNDGFTALQVAACSGQLETVKFLLDHGADINVVSNDGSTLLHSTSLNGQLNTIKYLFERGLDPHIKNYNGFTALQVAACSGQLETVKLLSERDSDINVLSNNGIILLKLASARGNLDVIKYLFEIGIDPHITDNDGFTALHTATYFHQLETVKFLTECGSDINVVSNNGTTLLHLASQNGYLETIKYLFEHGINPHVKDNDGFTALQVAACSGQLETVKFLSDYGADINVVSNDGNTLLHSTSLNGHLDTIKYLFEHGVSPYIRNHNGFTALQLAACSGQLEIVKFLTENGSDFNGANNYGQSVLHSASMNGHLDVVNYLLEIGVDISIRDCHGFTVLQSTTQYGDLKIVKFLIETHGLDINILSNNGYTLLHLASANGRLDTIKFFLELGMDPNIRDNHGFTPFHLVDGEDQSEIVKFFIEYGLDINIKSTDGFTLLHLTSADGRLEMVKFLLENGADFEARDNVGFTPLHLAAEWGQLDAVKLLVEHDVNYNVTTNDGRTPLHLSSGEGQLDMVKYFLQLGGDYNVRDDSGRTALHLAVLADNLDVVKLLVEGGGDVTVEDNGGHTALDFAIVIGHWDTINFLMEIETE